MVVSVAAVGAAPASLEAMARAEGSASHAWLRRLATDRPKPRDLSDAIHHLLMLHGRHPGMIDVAGSHDEAGTREWLAASAAAFAEERAYLNRLAVAAGPLPSTSGHAQSEAAVLAQCHALEMLVRSDRAGCAFGGAIGLVLDWAAIRTVLDAAAARLGVAAAPPTVPAATSTEAVAAAFAGSPATSRAICFGARQVWVQHRLLWDLLEARAHTRDTH